MCIENSYNIKESGSKWTCDITWETAPRIHKIVTRNSKHKRRTDLQIELLASSFDVNDSVVRSRLLETDRKLEDQRDIPSTFVAGKLCVSRILMI